MSNGTPAFRRTLTFSVSIAVVLILLGYGLFEARKLLMGPQITIESPQNGSSTSTAGVVISGTAENISFLTINDKPSFTDKTGHFAVTISPPAGYTIFTVKAVDRFGRRVSRSVSVTILTYCPVS